MSVQPLNPDAAPMDGGIDYTVFSDDIVSDTLYREDPEANWELDCESESATIAAMPDEYKPNEERFVEQ